MSLKFAGAVLIIVGCGGLGFLMALSYCREIRELKGLREAILWMLCELEFRQPALPVLIRGASDRCDAGPAYALRELAAELEAQIAPDAASCMEAVLTKLRFPDNTVGSNLRKLGSTLGEFDLPGQIASLQAVLADCRRDLEELEGGRAQRVRSYRTLGLCAGAALAILFV